MPPVVLSMRPKGPHVTLMVGLATAIVLVGLSMNATARNATGRNAGAAPTATPAAASPSPATPPLTAASPAPVAQTRATYAGRVNGGGAAIAIAVRDGAAVAYVCDGSRVESWLRGSASAGNLALTGANNASVHGTYEAGSASGSVAVGGRQWSFTVPVVKEPSGLYQATTTVRGAKVVGGWIVLPDGAQVGVLTTGDNPAPAPELDALSRTATVGGAPLTAASVNGSTGSGF
jgi:hypothetical protein